MSSNQHEPSTKNRKNGLNNALEKSLGETLLSQPVSDSNTSSQLDADPNNGSMIHTQLHDTFDQLVMTLTQLKSRLQHDANCGYLHWIPLSELESAAKVDPMEKAIELFLSLFFIDGQESNHTRSCHGLIGISPATAKVAATVNQAKKRFQTVMAAIKKQDPKQVSQIPFELPERHPAFRQALRSQCLSRLHLKQCYRQIPLLQQHPDRIGFTWSLDGRSITKISVEEAEKRLVKLGEEKPHIKAQLHTLSQLEPDQMGALRKVQKLAPAVKANLVFKQPEGPALRKTISAPLPILFPAFPYEELPAHKKLQISPPKEHLRLKRLDTQLSKEPFLKSINVYLSQPS